MYSKYAWEKYDDLEPIMSFNEGYKEFLSNGKNERLVVKESVELAKKHGFKELSEFETLKPGDKVYVTNKNKNIALKTAIFVSVFGILGAIIGANISIRIDVNILRKCFGVFLLLIAIHEIYTIIKWYKKQKMRNNNKNEI